DEWLAITARNDQEWRRLCEGIDAKEVASTAWPVAVEGRRAHRSEADVAVGAWAAQQNAEQAMRRLQAAGVPAGKVQDMRDCTEHDEQLAARQWLREVEDKMLGRPSLHCFPP